MECVNCTEDIVNQALVQARVVGGLHHVYLYKVLALELRRKRRDAVDDCLIVAQIVAHPGLIPL